MSKMFEVKGVKGFKKLMKEIAVTASTGKHDNELIGRCNIPLRVSHFYRMLNDVLQIITYIFFMCTDNSSCRFSYVV